MNQHAVNISESLHEISLKAFKNWVTKANFHLISQSYFKTSKNRVPKHYSRVYGKDLELFIKF